MTKTEFENWIQNKIDNFKKLSEDSFKFNDYVPNIADWWEKFDVFCDGDEPEE